MKSFDGATNWMEGFVIHYNYLREHSGIKNTPAKKAGLKYNAKRGWSNLIAWALEI